MKRSEAFHLAQIAVVQSPNIAPEKKLVVLKILSSQEYFEQFCEETGETKCDTSTTE